MSNYLNKLLFIIARLKRFISSFDANFAPQNAIRSMEKSMSPPSKKQNDYGSEEDANSFGRPMNQESEETNKQQVDAKGNYFQISN